jgi:hypothetical protein
MGQVSSLAAGDAGLKNPAGQAAGGQAKALGNSIAGENVLQAELKSLSLLLRCEPASSLGRRSIRWTVRGSWRDPIVLTLKSGDTQLIVNMLKIQQCDGRHYHHS